MTLGSSNTAFMPFVRFSFFPFSYFHLWFVPRSSPTLPSFFLVPDPLGLLDELSLFRFPPSPKPNAPNYGGFFFFFWIP